MRERMDAGAYYTAAVHRISTRIHTMYNSDSSSVTSYEPSTAQQVKCSRLVEVNIDILNIIVDLDVQ